MKRPAALSLSITGRASRYFNFAASACQLDCLGAGVVGVVMVLHWVVCGRLISDLGVRPDGALFDGSTPVLSDCEEPNYTGWRLYRDRSFLTLAAAMALGLFAQIGPIAHLFSIPVVPLGAQ